MASFSIRSQQNLSEAHKDLQTVFNYVIKHFDCTVLDGHRTKEEQEEAFRKGFSKVNWPNSKHNKIPSLAVDVVPYPIEWDNLDRMKFFIGYVLGVATMLKQYGKIENDIVSGIDWNSDTSLKDTTFFDHPHFEIKQ